MHTQTNKINSPSFQAEQITKTNRGYIHRLIPKSYRDTNSGRDRCYLGRDKKQQVAAKIKCLTETMTIKQAYMHMIDNDQNIMTDNLGHVLSFLSFKSISERRNRLADIGELLQSAEHALNKLKEHGGTIECIPSELWQIIKLPGAKDRQTTQGRALSANNIIRYLKERGLVEVEKSVQKKLIYKVKDKS